MVRLLLGDCLERLRELPDASVDACVTDPPYGLSFLSAAWDRAVPSVEVWREVWRVLKPGAHLLAFFGTRTYHRGVVAIEDAGFEIRDQIGWAFGSGFPKSHDVSKAIDKVDATEEQERRRLRFTAWVRGTGVTSKQIDEATGTNMGGHYTTAASQPAIMTREHLEACRHLLGHVPAWVERECDIRSVESRNFAAREVLQERTMTQGGGSSLQIRMGDLREVSAPITAPATPEAQRWAGWGTALKPAWEPIVVARKPLEGTVAANVLAWGTGGINVDGCRVGTQEAFGRGGMREKTRGYVGIKSNDMIPAKPQNASGRWPANLIHDGSDEVVGLFPVTTSNSRAAGVRKGIGYHGGRGDGGPEINGDSGSAARFFYCAKASRADREDGLWEFAPKRSADRQADDLPGGDNPRNRTNQPRRCHHPTVKPTDLMRYLCRLVTPPGGVVLDPFMGSGSTGRGAVLEGFSFIGCELDPEYLEIARARIAAVSPEPEPEPEPQAPAPAGQLHLW